MSWLALNRPEFLAPGFVRSIRAITRPKTIGIGTHTGLLIELCTGEWVVYDRAPGKGIQRSKVDQFLLGRRYRLAPPITDFGAVALAIGRLRAALQHPAEHFCDAIGKNCEHLVNYVLTGQKRSPQVAGAAMSAALFAVACFL